ALLFRMVGPPAHPGASAIAELLAHTKHHAGTSEACASSAGSPELEHRLRVVAVLEACDRGACLRRDSEARVKHRPRFLRRRRPARSCWPRSTRCGSCCG